MPQDATQVSAPVALVVEDDREMNRAIASTLARAGYRVEAAWDLGEGVRKALELRLDVVVADLPETNEEIFVRELRSHADVDEVPIIVLGSNADPASSARLLEEGASDYLVKPFAELELRARVEILVSRKRALERAQLAESTLARTREALECALRARDEVLSMVAHDLRNPLNAIVLQSCIMRRRGQVERRDTTPLERIARAAYRMNRLIQDLLDVTRLEAGQALAMERARLAPDGLLREAVEAQRFVASAASLDLRTEWGGCPDVMADRDRLLQVLDNLLGNAIKFTPSGGWVAVSAATQDDAVLFSVADTGPGLEPEAAAQLFDRFWQARASDRRGAGLGLSVAKAIVQAHGGDIWVDTMVGKGTRVSFTIPIAK